MTSNSKVTVRKFVESDYPKLTQFFIKAYGPQTAFQNVDFLKYYFGPRQKGQDTACLVAIDESSGEIVSHYGGLFFEILLNDQVLPIIWGVNAFTLSDWRGRGINSQIVEFIHNNNDINAVIGMPFDAPFFYKKLGYHIFDKETLSRFIYVCQEKTFEIIKAMPQDLNRAQQLLKVRTESITELDSAEIVQLSVSTIDQYQTDFGISKIATTHRSLEFFKWRLLNHPDIDYTVLAVVKNKKIVAYTALREEILQPHNYKVTRIIDLYGNPSEIPKLLQVIKKQAQQKSHIYIDFSFYGELYSNILIENQFDRLDGDDYSLLPQVTAPIENRPNHEFIVIQSKKYADKLKQLDKNNTYFTRVDADRDRIARIHQIRKLKHAK